MVAYDLASIWQAKRLALTCHILANPLPYTCLTLAIYLPGLAKSHCDSRKNFFSDIGVAMPMRRNSPSLGKGWPKAGVGAPAMAIRPLPVKRNSDV